jgi:hypothetical protein
MWSLKPYEPGDELGFWMRAKVAMLLGGVVLWLVGFALKWW